MRPWVRIVGITTLALALLLAGTGVALTIVANDFVRSGRIARNVSIEGLPVSGRTVAEATQLLQQQWAPRLPQEIKLTYAGGSVTVPASTLGATLELDKAAAEAYRVGRVGSVLDQVATQVRLRRRPVRLEVECAVEEAALDSALTGVAQKVNRKPRNAQVQVSDEDEVTVTPEVNGLTLDVPKSKAAMLAALKTPEATEVALTVTEEKPEVTKADLADLETVLSSYSTEFNSGQEDRTHNLTLAARALDRTVIKPGDTFSLNGIVGERTPQRGYRKAPIFGVGGTLIDDYGGGVCQVASTTYNAALLANIAIVERSCHIRTVKYVPLGRDAMVSYGSIDLKWRNSLPHAVLLVARVEGESLTVKLIGKRTDRCEVRIERSGVGVVEHGKKEVPDPKLEEGKREVEKPGWDGGRASVQRLVKVGDRWESNLSYSDYYPPQDDIVRVGKKKKPKPETTPSVPTTPGEEPSPDAGTAKDRDTVAPKGREAAAPQPDPATPKDRGAPAPRIRKPPRPKPARPNVPRVP